MAPYPQEIVVKRYLSWQLHDSRTHKRLSQKDLYQLNKSGKKVVIIDASSNGYIAGNAPGEVASIEAAARIPRETVYRITGFDAVLVKRYLVQDFVDVRTRKRVSRKHLKLLVENGTKIVVIDTTTKNYKDRLTEPSRSQGATRNGTRARLRATLSISSRDTRSVMISSPDGNLFGLT
jgi:hypothetical protein